MITCGVFIVVSFVNALASTNFTERYEKDPRFSAYLTAQKIYPDMNEVIADFFNDLSTTVSDLYALDITLSFQQENNDFFLYKPETPTYHFKSNIDLLLSPPRQRLHLTLQHHSGDCSGVRLVFKRQSSFTSSFFSGSGIAMERTDDIIILKISGDATHVFRIPQHRRSHRRVIKLNYWSYLRIPMDCVLYLVDVKKFKKHPSNQLRYSRLNNRPPELHGLKSNHIHNLETFNFVTSVEELEYMKLGDYNDTHALFQSIPQPSFGIPQNSIFSLYDPQRHRLSFDCDSFQMTLETLNEEKCRFEDEHFAGFSISTISDTIRQIRVDKHLLDHSISLQAHPDCRLRILTYSRMVSFASDSVFQKQMRYGMTRKAMETTFLTMVSESIQSPAIIMYRYVEMLSDLPNLFFQIYTFGYAVFRTSLRFYIVPSGLSLVVHTAQENTRRDSVRLTFSIAENCEIELHHKTPDGREKTFSEKGFHVEHYEERVTKLIVHRHLLNKNFQEGTQFSFIASCRLHLHKASRKLTMHLPRNRRIPKETISLQVAS